jgi:hypothetical protein
MRKPIIYTSGDRVMVKTRVGRREVWQLATFHAMQTRSRVIVSIWERKMDEEATRLVDLRSIRPYYDDPTDQQRRAKNAARKYKMGVRMFRVDKPHGQQFCVVALDAERGVAVGHLFRRKTLREVATHKLWPNISL